MVAGSILGIVSGSAVCPDVNSSTSRGYRYIPLPLVTPVLYRFVSLAIAVQQGGSHDAAERRFRLFGRTRCREPPRYCSATGTYHLMRHHIAVGRPPARDYRLTGVARLREIGGSRANPVHATRVEHLENGGGAVAFVLRIAPRLGAPDLARNRPIEPRRALEQQSIIVGREARTQVSLEWDDLGLRHLGQEKQDRERGCQLTWRLGSHTDHPHLRYHCAKIAISPKLSGHRSSVRL